MAYQIARERIQKSTQEKISNNSDVEYWQDVMSFYQPRTTLINMSDYGKHYEYLDDIMGGSIQFSDRVWSSVKSSIFSPFNGLKYYSNYRATSQAEEFYSWVAFDPAMREVIHRIAIPTLLVYGKKDLVAPVEVGEFIIAEINTDEESKRLLVLEHSRHGAEGEDRELFQKAMIEFIEQYR